MLSKKKRITKDLFQTIMKEGKVLHSPLFTFRYKAQKEPQYAFVAPKSVAKQAVLRNSLRRKGYSALQTYSPRSGIGIFFYKKRSPMPNSQEIRDSIKVFLEKAHIEYE